MRIAIITTILITFTILTSTSCQIKPTPGFNEQRAYQYVEHQVSLGPRTVGSEAHRQFIDWITAEFDQAGWVVESDLLKLSEITVNNIIAKRNSENPHIILGAHYDSRLFADQDPDPNMRSQPVPGANDGASGVAVLLELAWDIPTDLEKNIWIVLFDAEDNGNIPGWDWILGSRGFVGRLTTLPEAVVIVDMIGDADLNIYKEINSNAHLVNEIWNIANELGYQQFLPDYKYEIIDDHIPFIQEGIPAIDIIDFDYPYWHTTSDTLDKVSMESLDVVGETLLAWLNK